MIKLLSQTPSGPSVGEPDVAVWAALSVFSQTIVSPASIVTVLGRKQFGSHPGVDEPGAFCTFTCVPDDCDALIESGAI